MYVCNQRTIRLFSVLQSPRDEVYYHHLVVRRRRPKLAAHRRHNGIGAGLYVCMQLARHMSSEAKFTHTIVTKFSAD